MKEAKGRISWLDFLGGIGIISVVLCHTLEGTLRYTGYLGMWMSMFMIFVFFIKVGWLYEERKISNPEKPLPNMKEFIRRRIILRGKQYIVFSVCVFAADCVWVLLQKEAPKILLRDIYRTGCLAGIGTLWFLPVITFGEILFYIGKKPQKKYKYLVAGSIVLAFIYTIVLNRFYKDSMLFDIITTPFSVLAKSVFGTMLMIFGGYLRRFSGKYLRNLSSAKRVLLCIFLVAGSYILTVTCGDAAYADFNHLKSENPLFFFPCAMVISACVVLACEQIYLLGVRVRILEAAGNYSLVIMVTHYTIFLPLFRILLGAVLGNDALALEAPWDLVTAVLVLLSQIPVSWFLSRYYPELLGGKKSAKSA